VPVVRSALGGPQPQKEAQDRYRLPNNARGTLPLPALLNPRSLREPCGYRGTETPLVSWTTTAGQSG
jgi:hypothetical protein